MAVLHGNHAFSAKERKPKKKTVLYFFQNSFGFPENLFQI